MDLILEGLFIVGVVIISTVLIYSGYKRILKGG